jgi:hypothetical protein
MTTSTLSRIGIPTGTWKVDKSHSRVGFAVKTLGIATVRGKFRKFDGALELGEELADARAYGRVDAASVDTNLARRDKHLRSTDFLSAESHPESNRSTAQMLPCRPFAHLRGRLLSREGSSASLVLSRSVPLLTFVHLGKNDAQRAGRP